MTEQEVDRRCAIGGTVGGVLFAALVVALFAALCGSRAAPAQTDGSAPNVEIRVSRSPNLFDDGGAGEDYPSVPVGQSVHDAVLVDGHEDAFRFVYGHGSDPTPVCVFTATMREDHHLENVGGGRECGGARGDDRCAFIGEGYAVYAVAGGMCARFGVQPCSGIC